MPQKDSAEKAVRDIRRKTRRKFSAEEKIRIVLEGLRGEESIASLCRREGIVANLYYRWSKEFLEAGKKRLLGDTQREATSTEVTDLRKENARLKEVVAETVLENRLLKKSVLGSGSPDRKKMLRLLECDQDEIDGRVTGVAHFMPLAKVDGVYPAH